MLVQTTTRRIPAWALLVLRVGIFAALLAISAKVRIEIPGNPIPITMQTLAVLITGMALGPIEGALAVITYLGSIALGAPFDARGLGPAAFFSPTAGYLVGFVPGAFIAGLAWRTDNRGWQRVALSVALGIVATAVMFLFGWLGLMAVLKGNTGAALMAGVFPFIFIDLGKVLLAASLLKLGHEAWLRWAFGRAEGR